MSAPGGALARRPSEIDQQIIGESKAIAELRRLILQVAPSQASILVTGPSGCGKEVVARAIYAESRRAAKPYVPVNCGAIPRELLEAELFGHEKGAFTGAHVQRRGRFEESDAGTLFLDEIGDMPHDMQVKLLRVLEERTVQRVGGLGQIPVDIRIVSATHRNLDQAIDEGRFREDLFYRLAVFPIEIPSLAERAEDVPLLIRHFIDLSPNRSAPVRFSNAAIDRLVRHGWPGNVRELRNLVERTVILFGGQTVGAEQVESLLLRRGRLSAIERSALWQATDCLGPVPCEDAEAESEAEAEAEPIVLREVEACDNVVPIRPQSAMPSLAQDQPVPLRAMLAEIEQRYIQQALELSGGVVADAARLLSLQRTTLIEKMRKYDLSAA